jgi:ABC-type Mn2+/Zn2+ transport system permease subunit
MSEENVLLIITAITGILGVPVVTWLKTAFGWSGNAALGLAVAVSFAIGLVIAIVNGQVTGALVDPKQVADAFGVVFATATVLFKLLADGKK